MSKIEKVLSFNFGQFHLNRTISVKNDEFLKLSEWKKKNFCKKGQISVSSFGKYLKNRKKINIICENMIEDYKYGILKSGKKLSRGRIRDIRKQFMKKLGILQCPSCTFYKSCKEEYIDNTNKFNNIRKLVSNYSDKIHLAQFEKKINFLEELGYLDKNNIPTSRGEMASRIHGHEIVITEMFFSGLFEKAEAYEIACFVTSVIYEKRRNDKVGKFNVPEDIYIKLEKFSKSLEFFKKIEKKYKLSTIENLDITMIPVTYFWAKGLEFEEIIKITNLEEGDLIRTLRRVIDMLRQILSAVIDLPGTNDKIRNAIKLIKRSVVDPENDF
jgi:superfamily II RNA helicase